MLQSWRRRAELFRDFNTFQFASVLGMVFLIPVLIFMADIRPHGGGVSVDMPRVLHPVSMVGADREDAIKVAVTRDAKIYFRKEQIAVAVLPVKLEDYLKNPGVERKAYIVADARARWGAVKQVVDAVRAAGVTHIAFLTAQQRSAAFRM
jgi:biopolymer transport protein ExbD